MAPSGALSETLSSVTAIKLAEILKQREMFEDTKAELLKRVEAETKLRKKVTILLVGVKKLIDSGEIKANPDISLNNIETFLVQADYDPSVSRRLLQGWQETLVNELNVHSLKFEYASLCGRLVEECLSTPSSGAKVTSELLIDFGFETLAETEMLDQRMKWETMAFNAFPTDTAALGGYLNRIFSQSPIISKAHRG
ncbi:hypothetical protein VTL71DRAFT_16134 [Oculimacula yallundae]|uniref:Uncharacterized protein n=1 Tax=Oculimacula yallundae TaxID=86028 RepID=A0ABR4CDK7_9HELO